jgi:dolichol-phosphate mannosyltransferase
MTSLRSFNIETPPNAGFVYAAQCFLEPSPAMIHPPQLSQTVSIVIPTLNEAENVEPLVEQILATGLSPFEIIFVDDGSTDGTSDRIRALARQYPIKLIERENPTLGLSGAVIAGAKAASGDLLVVMDADLSHPPQKIPDLIQPLRNGAADMVIGSRYVKGGATPGWPWWRRTMSRVASAFAFPITRVHDSMCGFFAIPRTLLLELAPRATGFKIAFEAIVHGGRNLQVLEIPIAFRDRARGVSKMHFRIALIFFWRWLAALAGMRARRSNAWRIAGRGG